MTACLICGVPKDESVIDTCHYDLFGETLDESVLKFQQHVWAEARVAEEWPHGR